VQDKALNWVDRLAPWRIFERFHRIVVTGFAALADAVRTEVEILAVILMIERRCQ
jgi:hypothetical protein